MTFRVTLHDAKKKQVVPNTCFNTLPTFYARILPLAAIDVRPMTETIVEYLANVEVARSTKTFILAAITVQSSQG